MTFQKLKLVKTVIADDVPSKLGNALPLSINVWKWVPVHFKSFTYNFTQVKVKEVGIPHRVNVTSLKKLSFSLKNAVLKLSLL